MKFLLFTILLVAVSSFSIPKTVDSTNKLPDYKIPDWVHRDVFKHNLKYQYKTKDDDFIPWNDILGDNMQQFITEDYLPYKESSLKNH